MTSRLDLSTTLNVRVDGGVIVPTVGLHPRIVPDSVANRKSAGAVVVPSVTSNPVPPLKTVPVGAPRTLTTSDCRMPAPSYNVDVSVPLFATHQNVVGPAARPQALTRFGSVTAATPG